MLHSRLNNQFYYLGQYNGQHYFRNTVSYRQIVIDYAGELPEVGTTVTIIFGMNLKVIWTHKRTMAQEARNIEIAMSAYGQSNAKAKLARAMARRSYRNNLKYSYQYFC